MNHFMVCLRGTDGETLINLFDKEDNENWPLVVTWRFLEYGDSTLIVSIVDVEGDVHMTNIAKADRYGEYPCEFELVSDYNERYKIKMTYYPELERAYLSVVSF